MNEQEIRTVVRETLDSYSIDDERHPLKLLVSGKPWMNGAAMWKLTGVIIGVVSAWGGIMMWNIDVLRTVVAQNTQAIATKVDKIDVADRWRGAEQMEYAKRIDSILRYHEARINRLEKDK